MGNRIAAAMLCAGILTCAPGPAGAQWVRTDGPRECRVTALAADGPRLYASIEGCGLFVSSDDGAHWSALRSESPWPGVSCLGANGGEVFAGTTGGGLYYSADGGVTRRQINLSASNSYPSVACVAKIGDDLFAGGGGDLFVCHDPGHSSEVRRLAFPVEGKSRVWRIGSLAVIGEDLYVCDDHICVFVFKKSGGTWTGSEFAPLRRKGIACIAANGPALLAGGSGTVMIFPGSGVPMTEIGLDRGEDRSVDRLALSGRNLVASLTGATAQCLPGAVRYVDGGASGWKPAACGLKRTMVECFAAAGPSLFAGTSNGIYRSRDGGATWDKADQGLPVAPWIADLMAFGQGLVVRTVHGDWRARTGSLYLSDDKGRSWKAVDSGLPSEALLSSAAVAGRDLFAGARIPFEEKGIGVYRSRDDGRTWSPANSEPPLDSGVRELAAIGDRIYAGTGDRICVSRDAGASWADLNDGLPVKQGASLVGALDQTLYACVSSYYENFKPQGLSLASVISFLTGSVELNAAGPPTINGLFVLSKGYSTWTDTGIRLSRPIICLARIGSDLFIGTEKGLYLSRHLGRSGKAVKLEFYSFLSVFSLSAVGPDLYVGAADQLFLLKRNGDTWAVSDAGLPVQGRITCLRLIDEELYAGTIGAGVWRLSIPSPR